MRAWRRSFRAQTRGWAADFGDRTARGSAGHVLPPPGASPSGDRDHCRDRLDRLHRGGRASSAGRRHCRSAAVGSLMSLLSDAFTVFLRRISPPETQIEAAERSNKALREFLGNDPYFGKHVLDSFLNGSYARRTTVQPIKDVDIIVVVGPDWLESEPEVAMESLRSKLSQRYDSRRSRRRRRAVRITLSDMQLDVVLAVARDGLNQPIRIPDREVEKWIVTHPKQQLQLIRSLAGATQWNYA